jgi:alanyl-tRNA synthetase
VDVKGVKVLTAHLEGADVKTLRDTLDQLKDKLKIERHRARRRRGREGELIAGVTADLINAEGGRVGNFVANAGGRQGRRRPTWRRPADGLEGAAKALASVAGVGEQRL